MSTKRSRVPVVCLCGLGHQHGTLAMYDRHKCSCFRCRVRVAERRRNVRLGIPQHEPAQHVDPTGTVRRLRALAVIGVPLPVIAERLGTSMQHIQRLRDRGRPVHAATAARVRDAYNELWDAPAALRSVKTRNRAALHGWHPPLAWDDDTIDNPNAAPNQSDNKPTLDEIKVERFMAGTLRDRSHANASPERVEAIRRLAAYGLTDFDIGQRVGMTGNNVGQLRLRRGIPTASPRRGVPGGGGVAA